MSEFLLTGDNAAAFAEHLTKRNIPGDIRSVTEKLTAGLEQLGYSVLGTEPIVAKRSPDAKRTGKIFNLPIRLTIALRLATDRVVTATFEYHMAYAGIYKGDIATIEREVDALIALVQQRPETSICSACGTGNGADSRFCRVCGAASNGRVPAELEVLRLNAEVRTGHRAVIGGVATMLTMSAVAVSFILWGNPKGVNVGWGLLVIGQLISWIQLFYGIYVTHAALNPRSKTDIDLSSKIGTVEKPVNFPELASPAAFTSVTEHTTRSLTSVSTDEQSTPRRTTFDTMEN